MSEFSDMVRILFLISEHGRIEGRTRFQKLVFLLKETYEIPFSFEYTPYYYGPYSYDLSDYIGNLVAFDLLEESRTHLGSDIDRYDYILTEKGQEFIDKIISDSENPAELEIIRGPIKALKTQLTPILVREAKKIMAEISETS